MPEKKEHKSIGPIVGTFIIIIVLIIAALYVFASHINQQQAIQTQTPAGSADDIQTLKNDLTNSIK